MKKIILVLALTASCVFMTLSCNKADDETVKPLASYSGEELFRALYFSQGEAADHIQALRPRVEGYKTAVIANQEIKTLSENFATEIISKIKELDPTYFSKFKEQLSSKNYYAMDLTLTNGVKMIKAAGYRSSYASSFNLADEMAEKKVDFNAKEIQNLDLTKKENFEKFQKYLKDDYQINLKETDYKSGVAVPIYAAAVAWTIAAVVATVAVAINAAVYATVYLSVELWGGNSQMMQTLGKSNLVVQELALLL